MVSDIIIILISGIILILPVLFWMYLVIGFSHYELSRKNFFTGLASGSFIGVIFSPLSFPVITKILDTIFYTLTIIGQDSGVQLFLSLGSLFVLLFLLIFFVRVIISHSFTISFLQIIVSFLGYMLIIGISVVLIKGSLSLFLYSGGNISVGFGEYIFSFLGAIIGYYIVISLIEEGAKYISSISMSPSIYFMHKNQFLLFGVCAALGFSLLENILYFTMFIQQNGIVIDLIQIVFFRSIFSLCLHLFCSLLMSLGFYYLYKNRVRGSLRTGGIFGFFSFISIFSHMLFDVSLSYGYVGIIFFYTIALYVSFSLILDSPQDRGLLNTQL